MKKDLERKFKVFLQKYGLMLPEKHILGFTGSLALKKTTFNGKVIDYGIVSRKKVTNDFADYLVDCLQGTSTGIDTFIWHAFGESTAAESAADSQLTAETTQTRTSGTSTEGADTYIYQSVATKTFQAAATVGEHGLFNESGLSTGTLMDRSIFDGVAMSSGDQMQFTYSLTVVSSG